MRFTVYFNCSTLSMMWLLAFSREHGRGLRRLYDRRPAGPFNGCMATAPRPAPAHTLYSYTVSINTDSGNPARSNGKRITAGQITVGQEIFGARQSPRLSRAGAHSGMDRPAGALRARVEDRWDRPAAWAEVAHAGGPGERAIAVRANREVAWTYAISWVMAQAGSDQDR